ncbi:MAG: accessory gene regulator B family protein [Christensenellaceae bacterium]
MIKKIVDKAIEYDVILDDERELYTIAFTTLYFSIATWGTLILLSLFFGKLFPSLIFLVFHIPLRVYAGGFHQPTRIRCYIQSLVIFVLMLSGSITQTAQWNTYLFHIIFPLALVIFILAPVASSNKPLNNKEVSHHKIISRCVLILELILVIIFQQLGMNDCLYFALVSIFLVSVQIIIGFVDGRIKSYEK